MIEMPQHYIEMNKLLKKGKEVIEASNLAFTKVTRRKKRRRLRKRKEKS